MCRPLNYFELFLVFVSVVSGCVSICAFASSIGVPVGIAGSAIGLKNIRQVSRKREKSMVK